MRWGLLMLMLAIPGGCSGIDLLSAPPREIKHDNGPLTIPPPLREGPQR